MKALLLGSLALNVYVLGAMLVFALVSYPSFTGEGLAAYPAFNKTIGVAVVPFELLAFLVPLGLYAFDRSPRVHVVTALGVAYFVITFAWHLPAHRPLAAGTGGPLTALLVSQWARTVVQAVKVAVLGWVAFA